MWVKRKLVILLIGWVMLPSQTIFGQELLTSVDFFEMGQTIEPTASGRSASVTMPWFEEYELRTETRDFDLEEQEYTFRLSPSTGSKRRAQAALYQHQEDRPDFDAQERSCDLLSDRYADWVELYFLAQQKEVLDELAMILKDRQTVLNRLASSLDFDWPALINLREAETELFLRQAAKRTTEAQLKQAYGLAGVVLSFQDMTPVENLPAKLTGGTTFALDPELAYDMELAARELALEQAEQKQYLNFAQLRYRGPHSDLVRERLSVGVGLQLPNSGNQKIKIRELELEQEAIQREAQIENADQQFAFETRKQAWLLDYDYYQTLVRTYAEEKQEMERIGEQMRRKEGFNPLPLLAIKERAVRNRLQQLRLAEALFERYLDLQELTGALCAATGGELLR